MNIHALAQTRALAAAQLEALTQLEKRGDAEEQAAHLRAQALARAAYREAEQRYQSAIGLLSSAEIKAMGLPHG